MPPARVDYTQDHLQLSSKAGILRVVPNAILRISLCEMEDPIHQGDEAFHILHGAQNFWLIGPFIPGALAALHDLSVAHPQIPHVEVLVRSLPRKLRAPGMLGLRLFPIAGFGAFPLTDLPVLVNKETPHDV